ncbi:MAG: hypothetical protein LAN84_07490 [Acidobacteriia bacterium]|nr:hypothetical protein [Terriglobia bacterium]
MDSPAANPPMETPLAAMHRAGGAKLGVWFGCVLPDHFGEWQGEYRFARGSVALLDKNYRAHLCFTGADRVRYLNALLTNNIRDLQTGQGNASLLLTPQGHILAEIEVQALADRLLGVSYAMIRERLIATLEKFIIMDDVTLTDETQVWGTLALEGPRAATVVRGLTGVDITALPELGHAEIPSGKPGLSGRLVRRSPGGVAGAEFLVPRAQLAECWGVLQQAARAAGGGAAGYAALNALRLEQGVPWFGYDFGEKQIPHEAGLQESHISYVKGCYTGQEIVERVRSRGQVNRVRAGLRFAGGEPPAAGAPLLAGGKEAGYVTRAAFSPAAGAVIGMGYLRREHAAPGSQLECAGQAAEVIALPLAAPARP